MKSDWKKSQGQTGTFRHTAGTYSGDPDDKGEGLFMSVPTLNAVRGMWSHSLLSNLCFPKNKSVFDSDSGYFDTQFPARYALGLFMLFQLLKLRIFFRNFSQSLRGGAQAAFHLAPVFYHKYFLVKKERGTFQDFYILYHHLQLLKPKSYSLTFPWFDSCLI